MPISGDPDAAILLNDVIMPIAVPIAKNNRLPKRNDTPCHKSDLFRPVIFSP